MKTQWPGSGLAAGVLTLLALAAYDPIQGAEVTIKGSVVCNGACIADPKADDHVMVVFAIDGTPEIRAEVDKMMKELLLFVKKWEIK